MNNRLDKLVAMHNEMKNVMMEVEKENMELDKKIYNNKIIIKEKIMNELNRYKEYCEKLGLYDWKHEKCVIFQYHSFVISNDNFFIPAKAKGDIVFVIKDNNIYIRQCYGCGMSDTVIGTMYNKYNHIPNGYDVFWEKLYSLLMEERDNIEQNIIDVYLGKTEKEIRYVREERNEMKNKIFSMEMVLNK